MVPPLTWYSVWEGSRWGPGASGIQGEGSAYERLLGRKPLINLPCLPTELSPEQKEDMTERMSAHHERYRQKFKNTHIEKVEIGEKILAFVPKLRISV